MIPLALALGSSLAWGLADFLGGLKTRSLALPTVLLLSQAVGLVISGVAVVLAGEPVASASGTLAWAALSGVLDLAGLWALYRGLSRGSMSVVAPLAATAAIIPAVYGLAIGEQPSALALSGVGLAVVGVALAGRSQDPGDERTLARGVGLALIAALCFGLGFVAVDTASEGSIVWTLLANRVGSVIVLLIAWRVDTWAGDFTADGDDGAYVSRVAVRAFLPGSGTGDYAAVLAIGVLDLVAVGLFALASTQGLVSVVAALGSLYPLATVVLARLLLRERMTTAQLAGVSVALVGVLAISAA
ncbi:MAG: DMT family transporter [Thermoleophilaceae bacterium]|nr:DMT family transporter [Thermoleophilaceae bacterium]